MKVSAAVVVLIAVLSGAIVTGTKLGAFLVSSPIANPPHNEPTPPPGPDAPTLENVGDGVWTCPAPCVLIVPVSDLSTGQTIHVRLSMTPNDRASGRATVLIQFSSPEGEPIDSAGSPFALGSPWLEPTHLVSQ